MPASFQSWVRDQFHENRNSDTFMCLSDRCTSNLYKYRVLRCESFRCCYWHFSLNSLSIFNNSGNIQNVDDGGVGGSAGAFSGCLPPPKGKLVVLLIVVCFLGFEAALNPSDTFVLVFAVVISIVGVFCRIAFAALTSCSSLTSKMISRTTTEEVCMVGVNLPLHRCLLLTRAFFLPWLFQFLHFYDNRSFLSSIPLLAHCASLSSVLLGPGYLCLPLIVAPLPCCSARNLSGPPIPPITHDIRSAFAPKTSIPFSKY